MFEYMKFWFAKGLVGLTVLAIIACIVAIAATIGTVLDRRRKKNDSSHR